MANLRQRPQQHWDIGGGHRQRRASLFASDTLQQAACQCSLQFGQTL